MTDYPDDGRMAHLTAFQRRATIPIIACAATSALATSSLLCYLAITDYKRWRASRGQNKRNSFDRRMSRSKFKNQGYFWLVNLFCADLIQSIGWVLSSYNLARNSLWPGVACSVQGFFINSGDVGSSVWSLVIAIHTVLLLAGGQRTRIWATEKSTSGKGRWILALCIWLSIIFLGIIGPLAIEKIYPDKGPFYNGAQGGWCWIGKNYPYERIFFHYFFVFVDMIALSVLYSLVFFYIRSQLKKFNRETTGSTENNSSSGHELDRWQADIEGYTPTTESPPSPPIPGAPGRPSLSTSPVPRSTSPPLPATPFPPSPRPSQFLIPTNKPTTRLSYSSPPPVLERESSTTTDRKPSTLTQSITEGRHPSTVTTYTQPSTIPTTLATSEQIDLRNTPSVHNQVLARKRMLQVARSLLWYPFIYMCVTMPLTIGRLATFANDDWAVTAIFVGATCYACGGFCNVLLYTSTRKGIISWTSCFRRRRRASEDSVQEVENKANGKAITGGALSKGSNNLESQNVQSGRGKNGQPRSDDTDTDDEYEEEIQQIREKKDAKSLSRTNTRGSNVGVQNGYATTTRRNLADEEIGPLDVV